MTTVKLAKSIGHLAFYGTFEYYQNGNAQSGINVYGAPVTNAINVYGNRGGQFECPFRMWDDNAVRLTKIYGPALTDVDGVILACSDDSDDSDVELIEIEIPSEYLDLASDWHSGQDDLLYALSSTGDLTLGSRRPYSANADRSLTDQEWHVYLWGLLGCDVRRAAKAAAKMGHDDVLTLREFETFCEETAAELRTAYGLEDSDAV